MLTIQCQCESTALQWQEPKELWRLECCCNDCTAGVRYLHEAKGGPQPPEQRPCVFCGCHRQAVDEQGQARAPRVAADRHAGHQHVAGVFRVG